MKLTNHVKKKSLSDLFDYVLKDNLPDMKYCSKKDHIHFNDQSPMSHSQAVIIQSVAIRKRLIRLAETIGPVQQTGALKAR
jgi:hypothetical protein